MSGTQVDFAVTAGGGSVTGSPATTDEDGVARVTRWEVGLGANTLSASSAGISPTEFTANGIEAGGYNITIIPISPLTPAEQAIFDEAAQVWEEVIAGDIEDVVFSTPLDSGQACSNFGITEGSGLYRRG